MHGIGGGRGIIAGIANACHDRVQRHAGDAANVKTVIEHTLKLRRSASSENRGRGDV